MGHWWDCSDATGRFGCLNLRGRSCVEMVWTQGEGTSDPAGAELEMFCRDEYPRLVRLLSLYCGDVGTAEDLAQETLARVWRNWRRVGTMASPHLWARRVALNLAASWFRRRRTGARATARALRALDAVARRSRARIG